MSADPGVRRLLERLDRDDAIAKLGRALKPGEHVTLLGPTGRGKSTVVGDLIPYLDFDMVAILAPKGADPAYAEHGHSTRSWPPRRAWGETFRVMFGQMDDRQEDRPRVWRVETPIRKVSDFAALQGLYGQVLGSVLAKPESRPGKPGASLAVVVDDTRFTCDQLRMSKLLTANLIIGRSKRASIISNLQAPRWAPRECLDQVSHCLIWRNRDRDVAKRLAEISGDLDPKLIEAAIGTLGFHDFLWIDGRRDRVFVVDGRRRTMPVDAAAG